MTDITLKNISHCYHSQSGINSVYALKNINKVFKGGGAYALLGPSGCGKTTLLNLISGLLKPTEGKIFFDGVDVTDIPTSKRSIAQVFQFPVVYDTMTVFNNLAFPLRNHGVDEDKIKKRVHFIAEVLNLEDSLHQTASGLTADSKQKISLGRGLVREDINIIMFDEPLTVIDPRLKWKLRTKLKEVHKKIGSTLIYVTHDQTEALTFADQVSVIYEGEIVQNGTPIELFEKSEHVFVGHFIGSPGMNIIPCSIKNKKLSMLEYLLEVKNIEFQPEHVYQIGIRPEFLYFDSSGIEVEITKIQDLGRLKIIEMILNQYSLKMVTPENIKIPSNPKICFSSQSTHLYCDGWRVDCSVKIIK